MNEDTFFITKVIFGIIAAIFTLLAAILGFIDIAQDDKTENTKAWFKAKWKGINNSRWLNMPETTTRWLLDGRFSLSKLIWTITNNDLLIRILTASLSILLFIACLIYWGKWIAFLSIIISFGALLALFDNFLSVFLQNNIICAFYFLISIVGSALTTVFLWLQIILDQNLYFAALIMVLFIPFFWVATFFPLFLFASGTGDIDKSLERAISIFLVGVAGGFTLTLLALALGHLVEPSAYVPQTLQMLIFNVMFDGLTMAITFAILAKALSKEGLLRLPLAIVSDILVAGIFAVSSLYFGLIFTDKAIGLKETIYILFARSADNSHFELSPYFWVMHTTFIPTLLYLSLILFCWIGKALLIPVRWFFGRGHEHRNPMRLAAALCGIFVAVFTVLSFGAGSIQERVKDMKSKQNPAVINENK